MLPTHPARLSPLPQGWGLRHEDNQCSARFDGGITARVMWSPAGGARWAWWLNASCPTVDTYGESATRDDAIACAGRAAAAVLAAERACALAN
jgi:hypothetical protein